MYRTSSSSQTASTSPGEALSCRELRFGRLEVAMNGKRDL